MIEIQNLMKEFGNVTPLKDVNLSIRKGEVVAIIGPSGCGKSTLLRCINMLEHPSSGTIAVCGEEVTAPGCDLSKLRLKVGMIFQSFNLFQHQTVIENIMGPQMKVLGRGKQEAYDKAFSLLANVGLMQTQFQFPDELSGGQQQRVAIARALAMDPEILLLDEPTSALDPTMVGEVEAVLRNLVKQGTTMVLVTHDMNLARSIATRIVYLDEGVVYEEGAPEQIFLNPQREKTRRFIRSKQSLDIRVDGRAFDFPKAIASIELFGHRQGLSEKLLYRLQMAFEELCMIYLPGEVDGTFHAFASFDFDEKTNEVTLSIKHNAGVIPEEQLDSELSLIVIMRTAQDVQQEAVEEEGSPYTGKLTLIYQKEVGNAR